MIKDVLRLKLHGKLSHEAVARSLSISKGVVAKYVTLVTASGLMSWEAITALSGFGPLTPGLGQLQLIDICNSLLYGKEKENAMPTATLTSKGQITIPVDVRNELKVDAGDRVEFIQIAPGRYEFVAATHAVQELKGMFGKPSRAVSIDDMNKAIARRGALAR